MSCRAFKPLLALAAGGDLDGAELDRIHAHVKDCPPCFRELGRFRAALAPLRALAADRSVPDGLLCDVLEAGRVAMSAPKVRAERSAYWFATRFAAAAAVVFVSVIAGSALFDRGEREPGRIIRFPFNRELPAVENIDYPIRRDVFHGSSPLLRPANLHSATNLLPREDRMLKTRRSQPIPSEQDGESRDD